MPCRHANTPFSLQSGTPVLQQCVTSKERWPDVYVVNVYVVSLVNEGIQEQVLACHVNV